MHWRRSLAEQPLVSELETFLLQAFWQGTLVMTLPGVPEAQHLDPRVRVLDLCRHVPQNVGLFVIDRHEDLPAETTIEHIDGSLTVDARQQIVWPRDTAQQTPALLAAACAVLSKSAWDDYHKLVEPVLDLLKIERDAFGAFCTRKASHCRCSGFAPTNGLRRTRRGLTPVNGWANRLPLAPSSTARPSTGKKPKLCFPGYPRPGRYSGTN